MARPAVTLPKTLEVLIRSRLKMAASISVKQGMLEEPPVLMTASITAGDRMTAASDLRVALAQGDWGYSFGNGQKVTTLMKDRIPASLELGLYAFLGAFLFAIVFALIATYRRRPVVDGSVRTLTFLGLGTPPFWLGLLLLLVFSVELGWLPGPEGRLSPDLEPPPHHTGLYTVDALVAGQWSTFWDASKHLILPVFALGFAAFGAYAALRTGSTEAVNGLFPVFFIFLFISSMNLPRNLMTVAWFKWLATGNPVSYLIEGVRSLVITGWDAQALLLAFGIGLALVAVGFTLAASALSERLART